MSKILPNLDRRAWIIFLIVFVDLLGFGIILPLLPYYVESLGAGALAVGLLLSAYSFFQLIAAPVLGELSDRFGRRPVLVYSLAGTAISFVLMGVARSLPILFLARIIDGASGGNISTAQAYMADITSKEQRTQGMGLLAAAFSLGFILGPAIGGLLATYGYAVPALVAGAVSTLALVLTIFFLPETHKPLTILPSQKKRRAIFNLRDFYDVVMLPKVGLVVLVAFGVMFAFALMQSTFALLTIEVLDFTPEKNGLFFTYVGIIGIVVQMFLLKRITTRFTDRQVATIGMICMAIGLGVMGFASHIGLFLVAATFLAFGNGIANPVLTSLISKFSPKDEQGNIMGIYQSTGSIARLIGPALGGFIFTAIGARSPYVFATFILFLTAGVTYRYLHSETVMEKLKNKVKSLVGLSK